MLSYCLKFKQFITHWKIILLLYFTLYFCYLCFSHVYFTGGRGELTFTSLSLWVFLCPVYYQLRALFLNTFLELRVRSTLWMDVFIEQQPCWLLVFLYLVFLTCFLTIRTHMVFILFQLTCLSLRKTEFPSRCMVFTPLLVFVCLRKTEFLSCHKESTVLVTDTLRSIASLFIYVFLDALQVLLLRKTEFLSCYTVYVIMVTYQALRSQFTFRWVSTSWKHLGTYIPLI